MGVDFLTCDNCQRNFPDCGYYVHCNYEKCGKTWCSDKCAAEDGRINSDEAADPYEGSHISCSYCRKQKATDEQLIEFLLEKTKLTREKAEKLWTLKNTKKQ